MLRAIMICIALKPYRFNSPRIIPQQLLYHLEYYPEMLIVFLFNLLYFSSELFMS